MEKIVVKFLKKAAVSVIMSLAGIGAGHAENLTMWVHSGPGDERDVYVETVKLFNEAHPDIHVELMSLPEGNYNHQVARAAAEHKLPCVLDFDGPNVYNYAWNGWIIPLDGYQQIVRMQDKLLGTLSSQGLYRGSIYSVGQFDSGLAIWGNRAMLEKIGARIPKTTNSPWTLSEFEDILKKLKDSGVPYPLDMKINYGVGEWLTYGFSPIVQSFGGDLVDRSSYRTAQGFINGDAAVKAMQTVQSWVKNGYVDANTKKDTDFVERRSALSYVGHWTYEGYKKALGNDLVLIPMPRFGDKSVTGAGSWNWGISADCRAPDAAVKVILHLMSEREVVRVTNANGAVPALLSAVSKSKNFNTYGPLSVYAFQIIEGNARIRPQTPAYPAITAAFAKAVSNILKGGDVKAELDAAAGTIDDNIRDNGGYQLPPKKGLK